MEEVTISQSGSCLDSSIFGPGSLCDFVVLAAKPFAQWEAALEPAPSLEDMRSVESA
jgi:hypothetical protein